MKKIILGTTVILSIVAAPLIYNHYVQKQKTEQEFQSFYKQALIEDRIERKQVCGPIPEKTWNRHICEFELNSKFIARVKDKIKELDL